jgi:hypothetical protein
MNLNKDIEPAPPGAHITEAGHHWLEEIDFDGRSMGVRVLQWQPHAKRWCHSGDVAAGLNLDIRGWRYLEPCRQPSW